MAGLAASSAVACQAANSSFVTGGAVGRYGAAGAAGLLMGVGIGADSWQSKSLAMVINRQKRSTPSWNGETFSIQTVEARPTASTASPTLLVRCNATQESNESATSTTDSAQAERRESTKAAAAAGKAGSGPVSTATSPVRSANRTKPSAEKKQEGILELMAFSGPAPERINGRLAMIGFVICALNEKLSGLNFIEQAQRSPSSVLSWCFFISLASIIPKYISESSLSELLEAARKDGMPEQLKLANADLEQIVGRTAMFGFLGTVLVEAIFQGGVFEGSLKLPF